MKAHTKETQELMTPQLSLESLKDGNLRFQNGTVLARNLVEQIKDT
ncbi:MAG: carbonic anhydrase, partial [Ulvibacter sp.]